MILAYRSMIGSTLSAFSGGNIGTTREDAHLGQPLHPVEIPAEAERADFQSIAPPNNADASCDSTLTLRRWEGSVDGPPAAARMLQPASRTGRFVMWSGRRVLAIAQGLVVNFEGILPGTSLILLTLTVAGLIALSGRRAGEPPTRGDSPAALGTGQSRLNVLALGLLVGAGLANEVVIGRALAPHMWLPSYAMATVRTLQAIAALCGIALLMKSTIARWLRALAAGSSATPCDPQVLVIALVVPWLVLLAVTEWGRQDRLVGLWPLQIIILAFVVERG